jgi:hypothetical protein
MIINLVYQPITGLRKTCRELIPLNREKLKSTRYNRTLMLALTAY